MLLGISVAFFPKVVNITPSLSIHPPRI